jgi:DNA polymerase III epsilon subunit-like protein
VNALIKPDPTMIWNEEAAKIHGHQYSICVKEGRPIKQVLDWFIGDSREVDLIVAHNLSFDKRVLGAECQRLVNKGREEYCLEHWWPKHELCSMMQTVQLCKIPSKSERFKNEFKWPKLLELHEHLFPQQAIPSNLHDAGGDVACLVQCFRELVRRNVLPLPALSAADRPGDRFVKLFREVLFMIA